MAARTGNIRMRFKRRLTALALALTSCTETGTNEAPHPALGPSDVSYITNERLCDPSEAYVVAYRLESKSDSLRICVSADGFETCNSEPRSLAPDGLTYQRIETHRFAGGYDFSYRLYRKGREMDSGFFPVPGKTRAEVETMPQRVAFYFNGDSLALEYHREDSSYWTGWSVGQAHVKSYPFWSAYSVSGIDSAVISGLPRVKGFSLLDGTLDSSGRPHEVPFTDRYHLEVGKAYETFRYYGWPEGSPPYLRDRCLEMGFTYKPSATVPRDGLPDLIPEFSLSSMFYGSNQWNSIVFDRRFPGHPFLCDSARVCREPDSP